MVAELLICLGAGVAVVAFIFWSGTPEQLRQRRRDREDKLRAKERRAVIEENTKFAEEFDAIYQHHRITGEIRALKAQYDGTQQFCNFFGNHIFLAELLAKMQTAGYKLKAHEQQMAYRGFKIPTPD